MDARTLNCPMCGAAAASDATQCEHCGARLATVACPSCFGLGFLGSKFCPHCGARTERAPEGDETPKRCPRCSLDLKPVTLGLAHMHECEKCDGLWVNVATFDAICTDREKQSVIFEGAAPNPQPAPLTFALDDVRYVPCPVCGILMNRLNFARRAGVIVDVCKGHGTWFDRDELRHIVEFIRAGGLEKARDGDRAQWEAERRTRDFGKGGGQSGGSVFEGSPPADWRTGYEVIDVLVLIARALGSMLFR